MTRVDCVHRYPSVLGDTVSRPPILQCCVKRSALIFDFFASRCLHSRCMAATRGVGCVRDVCRDVVPTTSRPMQRMECNHWCITVWDGLPSRELHLRGVCVGVLRRRCGCVQRMPRRCISLAALRWPALHMCRDCHLCLCRVFSPARVGRFRRRHCDRWLVPYVKLGALGTDVRSGVSSWTRTPAVNSIPIIVPHSLSV